MAALQRLLCTGVATAGRCSRVAVDVQRVMAPGGTTLERLAGCSLREKPAHTRVRRHPSYDDDTVPDTARSGSWLVRWKCGEIIGHTLCSFAESEVEVTDSSAVAGLFPTVKT